MPPFLVRPRGLLVSALVVADHLPDVRQVRGPTPVAERQRAPRIQRPAHLFHRHERVFPPAAGPCGSTRNPAPPDPAPGVGPDRRTAGPRSASAPLHSWP